MIAITTINKLIYRLRLKLKDTDSLTYSKYEVLEAMNEALTELRRSATELYDTLSFPIPNPTKVNNDLHLEYGESVIGNDSDRLTEEDETGWPPDFDNLIIEYALITLSPGDYATKEQAKMLWVQKVRALASNFNIENNLIAGCYGHQSFRHIRKNRGEYHG